MKDKTTGEVLGGAQWNVHEENPYAKEAEKLTPYWYPDGTLIYSFVYMQ